MREISVTKLAEMTPKQRRQRLHGIAESTRLRLLNECSEVLAAIANEGLRKSEQ